MFYEDDMTAEELAMEAEMEAAEMAAWDREAAMIAAYEAEMEAAEEADGDCLDYED